MSSCLAHRDIELTPPPPPLTLQQALSSSILSHTVWKAHRIMGNQLSAVDLQLLVLERPRVDWVTDAVVSGNLSPHFILWAGRELSLRGSDVDHLVLCQPGLSGSWDCNST